jgi:hypothetical protein
LSVTAGEVLAGGQGAPRRPKETLKGDYKDGRCTAEVIAADD